MPQTMAISKEGQVNKDQYLNTSNKESSQEMFMWNNKALALTVEKLGIGAFDILTIWQTWTKQSAPDLWCRGNNKKISVKWSFVTITTDHGELGIVLTCLNLSLNTSENIFKKLQVLWTFNPPLDFQASVYYKLVKMHTYILKYSATNPRKSSCLPSVDLLSFLLQSCRSFKIQVCMHELSLLH